MTDAMTVEDAWQVLGRRGEQLATIATPSLLDVPVPHVEASGLDVPWPARAVLGDRFSPELDRWTDLSGALSPTYRGRWQPAVSSTVTGHQPGLRHPAVAELAELAELAESVLAGEHAPEGGESWWDAARVHDLRAEAINGEDAEIMSESAQARHLATA